MRTQEEQSLDALLRQLEAALKPLGAAEGRAGLRAIAAARERLRRLDARFSWRAQQLRLQLEQERQGPLPGLSEP